jgi:hypothetical protein
MLNFISLINNAQKLFTLFEVIPSMDDVEIREYNFIFNDDISLIIYVNNMPYPEKPPLSWNSGVYNRVAMKVLLAGVKNVLCKTIDNNKSQNNIIEVLSTHPNNKHIHFLTSDMDMSFIFVNAEIIEITGYQYDADISLY